jgi:hypothetical protein
VPSLYPLEKFRCYSELQQFLIIAGWVVSFFSTAWTSYKFICFIQKRKGKLKALVPEPTLRDVILSVIPACCSREASNIQRKLADSSGELLLPLAEQQDKATPTGLAVSPTDVRRILEKVAALECQMQQQNHEFQAQLRQLRMENQALSAPENDQSLHQVRRVHSIEEVK